MTRGTAKVRVGAALAGGALAVHELRYLIAHGGHAERVLEHERHAYLGLVTLAVGLLAAWALGGLVVRIAAARRRSPSARAASGGSGSARA